MSEMCSDMEVKWWEERMKSDMFFHFYNIYATVHFSEQIQDIIVQFHRYKCEEESEI